MENVKLKVLEQYSHDYLDGITFTPDKDVFKGSDGRYYKVLTSDEVDAETIQYSQALADNVLQEVITLCNQHDLGHITQLLAIDKSVLDSEIDTVELDCILGVSEVLDNEYGWIDDDGLHYFTICRV